MFVATNRITIKRGNGEDLESRFGAQGGVEGQAGFLGFEMWKLDKDEDTEEYLIVTHWESKEANMAWIHSDSFKQAHAGPHPDYLTGPGEFKTYEIRLTRTPQAATG